MRRGIIGAMRYRKLRIAWSVAWGIVAVLLIALWVLSYWWFDQFIRAVSASAYFGCTSVQGQIELGLTNDPSLSATFVKNRWLWKRFPMSRWQEALDGPVAYYVASAPGPFLSISIRKPSFSTTSFSTSTPAADAYEANVPYWMLVVIVSLAAVGPWLPWSNRFSLRTLLIATTLVAVGLGLIVWLR
jgi:hypothetical protein